MHTILLIVDGPLGKAFLEKLSRTYPHQNGYVVCYHHDNVIPENLPPFFGKISLDATSALRLGDVLKNDFDQIMIIVEEKRIAKEIVTHIRSYKPSLHCVLLDQWQESWNDPFLSVIPAFDVLVNRFIDFLPSVPTIAKNIGLGNGEIMEVLVPFGSAYAYRHITNIEQKNWRIAGIYRGNQFFLAKPNHMIRPNDILLLLGSPSTLRNIYRLIKAEPGQFPAPYGAHSYAFFDMNKMSDDEIIFALLQSRYFHSRIKSEKLFIRVVNPRLGEGYEALQALKFERNDHIEVNICFHKQRLNEIIRHDFVAFNAGVIIVPQQLFKLYDYRSLFFIHNKPIVSLGNEPLEALKESVILLSDNPSLEKVSSLFFDLSGQLGLVQSVCNFDPEGRAKKEIIEHFESLAKNYDRKITLVQNDKNPLSELAKREGILHFLPFDEDVVEASWFDILRPRPEKLFWMSDATQIFVPLGGNEKESHEIFY